VHFLSAVIVAIGTLMSSFWILSANSWMHTPAGVELRDGVFHVTSWWDAVFNPSFPYRLTHMVTAAFLTTSFVVIAVGAWYLRRGRDRAEAERMFSMTLWLVTFLAPLQIVLGDLHGLNTFAYQPAKVAAMEGHWETQKGAPLVLFAIPDAETERNSAEIKIPLLGSLILTHEAMGEVRGLKAWPQDERPHMPIVFFAFRIMVGIGFLMLFVAIASLVLRWRGRLFTAAWFHRLCLGCLPIGFIAMLSGWTTTEVGRQPWLVYGMLRTADGVSPSLTGGSVLASLIVYMTAYAIIFGAGVYYMVRLVWHGPEAVRPDHAGPGRSPKRPISVAEAPLRGGD
jgi:cytochrome d ubiquinol oxidase subunit I